MVFNSLDFGIFLAICLALYFSMQAFGLHRLQNRMLLVASYVFYAAWDWRFTSLIALSTVVDYGVALALVHSDDPRRRRWLLALSLVVNLGVLGFFKYANFFIDSLGDLLALLGVTLPPHTLEIVLPVGISFYTFQTLSYTLDVHRRAIEPTRDFLDFALFVSFFPQLVAGPIERASSILPQIAKRREPSWEGIRSGTWLIFWGLYKKIVIADNLGKFVDFVYGAGNATTGGEMWLAMYAFAFQIYCDFSGYSDIARGCARIMGFELMLNFNLPYFARNPAEFWQRWHISLSTWLRDYVFFMLLGGASRSARRASVNLFLTMLLGGLWHGAAWPFVAWGAYHGALLVAHRRLEGPLARVTPRGWLGDPLWRIASIVVTFHLMCVGLLIFRSADIAQVISCFTLLGAGLDAEALQLWLAPLTLLLAPLLLMQLAQAYAGDLELVLRLPLPLRIAIYAALASMMLVLGDSGGKAFIYFQF